MEDAQRESRPAALVAAVGVLFALAWLVVNVEFNYHGQISGLFWTGSAVPLPADLEQRTFRQQNDSAGYDGQYYRLVAHDPLARRGLVAFVDNPRLRWRRIGVPGLAALLSAGADGYVEFAYVAVELIFVFPGVFWLGRYAACHGVSRWWGLAFLLIPAVAVSLDRMTIDLPLAALAIGLIVYSEAGASPRPKAYAILCAAPLVRETGMVLVAAWCVYSGLRRDWRAAIRGAACALPALAAWAYVHTRTPVDGTRWVATYPFSGLINHTLEGIAGPTTTWWLKAAAAFEILALAGIWAALLLSGYLAWKRRMGLIELTAILFAVFAAALGKLDIWSSAYATGRTMSPLLIVLGLIAIRDRRVLFALPLFLVVPRIALQYEAQLRNALRAVL